MSTALAAGAGWATAAGADPLYDASFDARFEAVADRALLDDFTREAIRVGQYDQAISSLETVLFTDPDDLGARLALARLYYHVGSFDIALGHVNEGLALAGAFPDFEAAFIELRSRIERAQGDVRAYVDVTVGAEVDNARTFDPNTTPNDFEGTTTGFFAAVDGVIEFDLDTPSRDIITVTGGLGFDQPFADTDFDGDRDRFDAVSGYGAITLSKGLPDLIDTLRLDVSGYGEYRDLGGGREKREFGVRTRTSVRPSVETLVYADLNYGWLGESPNLYVDDRWSYALGSIVRLAPGWTAAASVGRRHTRGDVSDVVGPGSGYEVAGTTVDASLTHLLYVFDDGRGWFQELSAGYRDEDVLDYGKLESGPPTLLLADRRAWRVGWDHTVQTGTHSQVKFGVGYRNERISNEGEPDTTADVWSGHVRFTYRFE